jgi:hypothetical protein
MDPTPGASVQRSNSLKPHSNRTRPPTDLSSAPPAPPPPQGYAPRHPESDQPGPNKPIDRVRGDEVDPGVGGSPSGQPRTRTGSDPNVRVKNARQVGDWQLGKTIGAGSMGKVKTATNVYTGEKVGLTRAHLCEWRKEVQGLTSNALARACLDSARSRLFLGIRHRLYLSLLTGKPWPLVSNLKRPLPFVTLPKRRGRSVKHQSPSCSTTLISAG